MSAVAVVQAAVIVADTINNIVNAADKRKYQEAFALMSDSQQLELATKIASVQTQSERERVLADSYFSTFEQNKKNAFNKETTQMIVIVAVTLALLGTVLAYKNYKKKK